MFIFIFFLRVLFIYLGEKDLFLFLPDQDRYLNESQAFENIESFNPLNFSDFFGNSHWFYYFFNYLVLSLFGNEIYIKIINSIISIIAGLVLILFLKKQTNSLKISDSLFLWALIPDVLVWSTLYNLKDSFILFFYVVLVTKAFDLLKENKYKFSLTKIIFTITGFLLFFTRSYLLLIILISMFCYLIFKHTRINKIFILGISFVLVFIFFNYTIDLSNLVIAKTFPEYLQSIFRFILTPFGFFSLSEFYYNFIGIYYIIGISLFVLMFIKVRVINDLNFYLFLNFFTYIIFYGFLIINNGPRQKLPLTIFFFIALTHFIQKSKFIKNA